MTAVYKTGQITLANGSAVVTGVGTAWATMLIAGGIIFPVAGGNPLAIQSVDSNTSITAEKPWAGVSGTYDYVLVRWSADEEQNSVNSSILATIYAELQAGSLWKYDVAGSATDRATYNERPKGFSYLVIDTNPAQLFIKASAASGDWAGPFTYGVGPIGPEGPAGYVNPRGTYSAVTAYARNDGVLYNGSSFVALQATTGNAPPTLPTTSNSYWQLTAIKGTDGSGTGDVVGPAGVTDDMPAFFDGTTGKLLKFKSKSQFKTWLAATAADVSFDNSAANLPGSPTTVQAAINAIGSSGGKNDALFAIEISDLKGQRMGMVGGVSDSFDDETGIATKTNATYDATNDLYSPTVLSAGSGPYGPSGGAGGGTFNNNTGANSGNGKTPSGYGGGAGAAAGGSTGPGVGAPGAPGIIVVQYVTSGGVNITVVLTSGTSWTVPSDWNSANNTIETIGAGGGSGSGYASGGSSSRNAGGGGGGGAYSKTTNLTLTPGASVSYQVGTSVANANGGDTWFNGASLAASSVGAKGGGGGANGSVSGSGAGGAGGASASGIGTVKYSGGAGGTPTQNDGSGGGGGGGAGGPSGAGGAAAGNSAANGGGGGGANGGSSGTGSTGGNGRLGTGGGATGNPGGAASSGTGAGGGGALSSTTVNHSVANLTGGAGAQDDIWAIASLYNNMTLVSVAYTASSVPSVARIAVQLADALTLTPGTDFTMEVSRDNGTTWTAVTLALTMPLFGGVKMYEGVATITGQPSGTSMKWRFKTLTNKGIIASGVVLQQS